VLKGVSRLARGGPVPGRDRPPAPAATTFRTRHPEGVTLIELLIVMLVIGVLASIAIPKFGSVKQRAYRTQGLADLSSLRVAEEAFFADSNRYGTFAEVATRFSPTMGAPAVLPAIWYWSATVTHPQLPGMTCGIAVATTNPVDASSGEGEPICK
jgi:type IV pilus assembly protein PilA